MYVGLIVLLLYLEFKILVIFNGSARGAQMLLFVLNNLFLLSLFRFIREMKMSVSHGH